MTCDTRKTMLYITRWVKRKFKSRYLALIGPETGSSYNFKLLDAYNLSYIKKSENVHMINFGHWSITSRIHFLLEPVLSTNYFFIHRLLSIYTKFWGEVWCTIYSFILLLNVYIFWYLLRLALQHLVVVVPSMLQKR